ncbi:MAG: hypothetical protein RL150_587 [Candidatus Parcubacteria bacterium]|jgi:hypothetical protein
MFKRAAFYLIILAFLFLLGVPAAKAQIAPDIFTGSLSTTLSPSIPSANSSVTATVENYAIDLGRSTITWNTSDGQTSSGLGLRTFIFSTPAVGQTQTVSVRVVGSNGKTYEDSITLTPGAVDLLVEADTYTPPLYKGRSLFTPQSLVTIAAIPDIRTGGTKISSKELVYTWEKNGQVLQQASGVGKDTISFVGNLAPTPFFVTVVVETVNGGVQAQKRIEVTPKNTSVLVYESNPLFGNLFERAITSRFRFDREEVGLVAIPYFFSASSRDDASIEYSWTENEKPIDLPTLGSKLTFTNRGKAKSGISRINVGTNHLSNILQDAKINFALDVVGDETLENELQTGNVTVF